ncbi:MAG: hypothetical protein ACE5J9_03445 [Methanosarcinales archaeon]
MKNILILLLLLLLFPQIMVPVVFSEPIQNQHLKVTKITMEFHRTDAKFIIEYDLDFLTKLYILILGSKDLDPILKEIFFNYLNYKDIEIKKIYQEYAIVLAKNVTKYNEGWYLHDAHKFNTAIDQLIIKYPDGSSEVLRNTNRTKNLFYK